MTSTYKYYNLSTVSNPPSTRNRHVLSILCSMFSGVFSNQADLAPNFAGTLMALTNMLATIPGILVPTLVGIMTHGTEGLAPWHTGEIKVQ